MWSDNMYEIFIQQPSINELVCSSNGNPVEKAVPDYYIYK